MCFVFVGCLCLAWLSPCAAVVCSCVLLWFSPSVLCVVCVCLVCFPCVVFGLLVLRPCCLVYVLALDHLCSPCDVVFCLFVVTLSCVCVLFVFGKVYPCVAFLCVCSIVCCAFVFCVFVWLCLIGCFLCVLRLLFVCVWRGCPHVLLPARLCYCGFPHVLFMLFVFVWCVSHGLCLVDCFTYVLCCLFASA